MKIMNANEMKEMSSFGQAEFEKAVLDGPLFKSVVRSIEDAALEGRKTWSCSISDSTPFREMGIIKDALIEAGYKCEITNRKEKNFFGMPYNVSMFIVEW